jgi:hypothetical protein
LSPDSRPAARGDAHRRERGEQARPAIAQPHRLGPEQDHHELQQRAQKPEVGDAGDRQRQHAVAAQARDAEDDLPPWIRVDAAQVESRGHRGNAPAESRPDDRDGDDDRSDDPQSIVPGIEHEAAERGAGDDRDERAHLEQAVRSRQVGIGQDLRQDAVFRRTEERRLDGNQEQHRVGDLEPSCGKRKQRQDRRHDLERLRHDEDGPLAVDVCQLAGVAGEQQEGEDEDDPDQRQLPAGAVRRRRVDREHRHDDLEQIIVERAEELRPEKRLQSFVRQRVAVTVPGHDWLLG